MSRWPLLLVPLVLATMACESLAPRPRPAAERSDELARLREKVRELERQARMNEVEVTRLKRQVAELGNRLEQDRAPASPPPTEPLPRQAPTTVTSPRPPGAGDLESEDLEMPPAAAASQPQLVSAASPLSAEAQALYDRGYTLYHQGSYVDAESAFQNFLQLHAASDLADNALFWIGEARLRRGDLSGALAAFRETVTRFPRGNKVPDALFRAGDCLEKLGDLEGARASWRQTIERFPNSAAAALAEERLAAVP